VKRNPNPILAAKERLARNLKHLSSYCRAGSVSSLGAGLYRRLNIHRDRDALDWILRSSPDFDKLGWCSDFDKLGWWPSTGLLREIQNDVLFLAERERVGLIFPTWKAFEQVDKRLTKLQLKKRVDNLIGRARDVLADESVLGKAVTRAKAGNAQDQCLLRDMVLDAQKLEELLQADRQMVIQRCMAQPLLCWAITIGHSMVKDLPYMAESFSTVEEFQASHRRARRRESVRRHRLGKKNLSKSVTPF
jgi:hypothetical protein